MGAADRSKLAPAGGRALRGATPSRTRVLPARRLVGGRRLHRTGTHRGYGQHLDDVARRRALTPKRNTPSSGDSAFGWVRRRKIIHHSAGEIACATKTSRVTPLVERTVSAARLATRVEGCASARRVHHLAGAAVSHRDFLQVAGEGRRFLDLAIGPDDRLLAPIEIKIAFICLLPLRSSRSRMPQEPIR